MKAALPAVVTVLLAACGSAPEKNNATDSAGHDHAGHDHAAMQEHNTAGAAVQLKDDKLNAVYQHYVHLTTALINSDLAEARIAGNAIAAGAREMSNGVAVAASAEKIAASGDIEALRTAYSTLSNDFISLAKASGLKSGTLYVDFCPMALNDKGAYWLSAGKEIQNPYFGEKMKTCGEIKDSIQ